MNTFFYLGIDRVDLGIAVTIEFIGPITVAAVATRSRRNALALLFAIAGVAILGGTEIDGNALGLFFIFLASVMWAAYIVIGSRVARFDRGVSGLGVGLAIGALAIVPIGAPGSLDVWSSPRLLALCLLVGVFSNAIGYGIDQFTMRRIPVRRFSLLLALLPVTAVLIGWIALDQQPSGIEFAGIALVDRRRDGPRARGTRTARTRDPHRTRLTAILIRQQLDRLDPYHRRSIRAIILPHPPGDQSSRRTSAEIFVVSAAALLLEISYTRIISFKLYYYYTYLVIGLALLGLGSGAVIVAVSKRLDGLSTRSLLARCIARLDRRRGDRIASWWRSHHWTRCRSGPEVGRCSLAAIGQLLLIALGLYVSFLPIGMCISALFARRRSDDINRLYFSDLAGAALACLIIVPLIATVGPVSVIAIVAILLLGTGVHLSDVSWRSTAGRVGLAERRRRRHPPGHRRVQSRRWRPRSAPRRAKASGPTHRSPRPSGVPCSGSTRSNSPQHHLVPRRHLGVGHLAVGRRPDVVDPVRPQRSVRPLRRTRYATRADADHRRGRRQRDRGSDPLRRPEQIDAVELNPATADLLTGQVRRLHLRPRRPPRGQLRRRRRAQLPREVGHRLRPDLVRRPGQLRGVECRIERRVRAVGELPVHPGDARGIARPPQRRRHGGDAVRGEGLRVRVRTVRLASPRPHAPPTTRVGYGDVAENVAVVTSTRRRVPVRRLHDDHEAVTVRPTTSSNESTAQVAEVPGGTVRYLPGRSRRRRRPRQQHHLVARRRGRLHTSPTTRTTCERSPTIGRSSGISRRSRDVIGDSASPSPTSMSRSASASESSSSCSGCRSFSLRSSCSCRSSSCETRGNSFPHKANTAPIFALLGLAFIAFEIVLIQRFSLMLGYPTYSLTVTLMAILLSTGVGALVSERWHHTAASDAGLARRRGRCARGRSTRLPYRRSRAHCSDGRSSPRQASWHCCAPRSGSVSACSCP